MSKEIINITDIIAFLFCPRKVYLKKIRKIREPLTKAMLNGKLRHDILDIFNKIEPQIVSSITYSATKHQIIEIYKNQLLQIKNEVFHRNQRMVNSFKIDENQFYKDLLIYLEEDVSLRADTIIKTIGLGFFGKELWRNLKPKYLTEFKIVSEELGIQGRIDRIKLGEQIIPYEIKTRKEIFPADELQLAGYALLLEKEFSKPVDFGVIEVLDKSEKIEISKEMKDKILETAEQIRNLRDAPQILSNFKKCSSCSLSQDCLRE